MDTRRSTRSYKYYRTGSWGKDHTIRWSECWPHPVQFNFIQMIWCIPWSINYSTWCLEWHNLFIPHSTRLIYLFSGIHFKYVFNACPTYQLLSTGGWRVILLLRMLFQSTARAFKYIKSVSSTLVLPRCYLPHYFISKMGVLLRFQWPYWLHGFIRLSMHSYPFVHFGAKKPYRLNHRV